MVLQLSEPLLTMALNSNLPCLGYMGDNDLHRSRGEESHLVAMHREVQLAALIVRHAGECRPRQRVAVCSKLSLRAEQHHELPSSTGVCAHRADKQAFQWHALLKHTSAMHPFYGTARHEHESQS